MEDTSLFIEFMGDTPLVRVVDYLLTERDLDFSITDLARNAGISRATLYRIWEHLLKKGFIIPTRTIGQAKLYKLNKESSKIKKLIEIDDILILEEIKKKSKKEKIEIPA